MLTDQELRMECLQLAAGRQCKNPIDEAQKMFSFVRGDMFTTKVQVAPSAGIERPVDRPSIFDLRPQDRGIPS